MKSLEKAVKEREKLLEPLSVEAVMKEVERALQVRGGTTGKGVRRGAAPPKEPIFRLASSAEDLDTLHSHGFAVVKDFVTKKMLVEPYTVGNSSDLLWSEKWDLSEGDWEGLWRRTLEKAFNSEDFHSVPLEQRSVGGGEREVFALEVHEESRDAPYNEVLKSVISSAGTGELKAPEGTLRAVKTAEPKNTAVVVQSLDVVISGGSTNILPPCLRVFGDVASPAIRPIHVFKQCNAQLDTDFKTVEEGMTA